MKNIELNPSGLSTLTALILLCTLLLGIAFSNTRLQAPPSGKVLGLSFECVQVSNLETSVNYYKALGFTVVGDPNPPWTKDEAANRLYSTPGAMSRTAALSINSTGSGKPFILYLREYKNFKRGSRADFPARNPSSSHIGLMVADADTLWAQLKSAGLLRALSWDAKLVRMPGQTSGGIAYVMDPDGFDIEIIGVRPAAAAGAQKVPDRLSLHHLGLSVLDSGKSKNFYGGLLGAKFPDALPNWVSGDMYDAAVGGHGYVIRLINGAFPEAAAPQTEMRFELVEYQKPDIQKIPEYRYSDVAVSCVGLQVDGLDAFYARLNAAGIKSWSGNGIVQKKDGTRALVVRDPDVGAFVELFERSGK
jgi:catechol 2,3-dioxygenase-like lactoylglutathione lyase family enzyme